MTDPIERLRKLASLLDSPAKMIVSATDRRGFLWDWWNVSAEAVPLLLEKLEAERGPPACWCGKPLEVAGGMPEDGKDGTRFYVCPEHRELHGHYGQWYYKQRLDVALAAIREYGLGHKVNCRKWIHDNYTGSSYLSDEPCTCGRDERQAKLLEGE